MGIKFKDGLLVRKLEDGYILGTFNRRFTGIIKILSANDAMQGRNQEYSVYIAG